MFVRIKNIKGKPYAYAVENTWTGKGARQKVSQYLGRVALLERKSTDTFQPPEGFDRFVEERRFAAVVRALVEHELQQHESEGIAVDFDAKTVRSNNKKVVLQLNEGFLCDFTLQNLLRYRPGKDNTGMTLAEQIVAAGIKAEPELFVQLYAKMRREHAQKEVKDEEFYY